MQNKNPIPLQIQWEKRLNVGKRKYQKNVFSMPQRIAICYKKIFLKQIVGNISITNCSLHALQKIHIKLEKKESKYISKKKKIFI